MEELNLDCEVAALWREIYEVEGGDVDAALTKAHQQIAELLMDAVAWDVAAAAMRDTTQAPIAPYAPACAA